jgi:hypothetical protein
MKGLKNKMAVGARIVVILSVILLGTVNATKAAPLGEFGMVDIPGVGPVVLTDVPQNIVTLTVTPRMGGYLLFIADVSGSLEQSRTSSPSDAASFTACITPTSGGASVPGLNACKTMTIFAGALVSLQMNTLFMFPVPVTEHGPVTYYLTAYLDAPASGTCSVKAGLAAILLPGLLRIP